MRETKFRGKALMTKDELDYQDIPNYKGWIKGSLVVDGNSRYIVGEIIEASDDGLIHEWWVKVDPKSVGQYTGLKDEKGREIYERDILSYESRIASKKILVVEWSQWDAMFNFGGIRVDYATINSEVIGNIYENPELLKDE